MCAFYGQASLSGTSIGRGLRDGEWVKLPSEREKNAD
jgi:hypothetical protein